MGARSGSNFLSTLKKLNAEIWLGGERVAEVTSHPALRNCARSIASLYDMQMERVEQMTYRTDDGGRSGLSFIQPRSIEEVRKRSRMMAAWANFSGGMLARTPDYLNVCIAAMAAARDFFVAGDPRYGDNIASYYLEARKRDWCGTHTFLNPATRLIEKTDSGIVVRGHGTGATLAPFAEELLALPPASVQDEAQALAFAIPCNTKGVKFICRDSFDTGRSHFDAPLASRFDATDSVVIFDDVMVGWERVFLCGDIERSKALFDETGAGAAMMHQEVVKSVSQAEFMLGLAARIAEVNDASALPHVRNLIGEMIATTETMRASLLDAEADAAPNKWGRMAPALAPLQSAGNLFLKMRPRMAEIVRLVGGPDLIAVPSERDLASPIGPEVEKSFATPNASARERAALYHLAWDATSSAFAARQMPPERPSAEDSAPVAQSPAIDLQSLTRRIKDFLARTD